MDINETSAIWTQQRADNALDRTVAPDDEMYLYGPDWYFAVGLSGLRCVLQALSACHLSSVSSILDLPCGHGRVARYFRAAFPTAELTFCDLNRSGVDFCVNQFSGRGIYSQVDLRRVALGGPFDVIWVGSLFTHLDASRVE